MADKESEKPLNETKRPVKVTTTEAILCFICPLIGLLFAIIIIFKREFRRALSISVYSCLGLVVWTIFRAATTSMPSETNQTTVAQQLQSEVSQQNAIRSQYNTSELRMDSITAGSDLTYTVKMTLLKYKAGDIDKMKYQSNLYKRDRQSFCNDSAMRSMLAKGVKAQHFVYGNDGKLIDLITLTIADCSGH